MNGNGIPKIEELFDGYDLDGYISAIPGVHGDLSFKYRPIDPLTSRRLAVKKSAIVSNKGLSDEDKELLCEMATIEMVCGNIISWGLEGKPSVAAVLRHFPDYRYTRLMQIVIGDWPATQSRTPIPATRLNATRATW